MHKPRLYKYKEGVIVKNGVFTLLGLWEVKDLFLIWHLAQRG